jgi:hypothetical protein
MIPVSNLGLPAVLVAQLLLGVRTRGAAVHGYFVTFAAGMASSIQHFGV